MLVLVKNNVILEVYDDDSVNLKTLEVMHPNCNIIRPSIDFPSEHAKKLIRMYKDEIVGKVSVKITADKNKIVADGIDEAKIGVEIASCQPGEIINEIELKIDEVVVPLELEDNKGSILFSTKIKGLHIISIDSSDVLFMEECVLAI